MSLIQTEHILLFGQQCPLGIGAMDPSEHFSSKQATSEQSVGQSFLLGQQVPGGTGEMLPFGHLDWIQVMFVQLG
jgi:hypothetical protein